MEAHSLYGSHRYIDNGNVVDGVGYQTSLVVQWFGITDIVTDAYTPGQEDHLTDGQTMIPPVVRALLESQTMLISYLEREGGEGGQDSTIIAQIYVKKYTYIFGVGSIWDGPGAQIN